MQPIIPANEIPERADNRNEKYRYPWLILNPGESFAFSPKIKILSARVMCANMGMQEGRKFECFLGKDGVIYARRVDGIVRTDPPAPGPLPMAEILTTTPEAAEVFGVFGEKCPDNVKNIVNPPEPPVGPYPTTAEECRAIGRQREADRKAGLYKDHT